MKNISFVEKLKAAGGQEQLQHKPVECFNLAGS